MALTAAALTTLAKANAEIGTSGEDDLVEQLIEAISSRIATYCNRTFYFEEDISESIGGYGGTQLVVARPPIVDITSIALDGNTVSSEYYSYPNADAGIIYHELGWDNTALASGSWVTVDKLAGTENPIYVVTYDGGYVTPQQAVDDVTLTRNLPLDLEDACLEWVNARYQRKGKDPRLQGEKILSWSAQYSVTAQQNQEMPEYVRSVIDRYVLMAIGV
jgi:hypothetical protein